MKKLLSVLCLLLALSLMLASCDQVFCKHRDTDDDSLCDKCGTNYSDGIDVAADAPQETETDTVQAVFLEAQKLGYTGSLDEFLALCKGADGLGIASVKIDDDGNLLVYYSNAPAAAINLGKIVGPKGDTGAQGPQGEQGVPGTNGVTPHIGENGNWWIGTNDTGIKAQGAQGEAGTDGVTPQIRINADTNYWEISTDEGKTWLSTDTQATGTQGVGIEGVAIDAQGRLVITLTDGSVLDPVEIPEKHTYGDWIAYGNSLCLATHFYRACTECGNLEWKLVQAPGHDYRTEKTYAPTCQEQGYDKLICNGCGHTLYTNYTPSAHDWASDYSYNSSSHWIACKKCTAGKDYSKHSVNADHSCSICGAQDLNTIDIMGVEMPANLVKFEANKGPNSTFTNKNGTYAVGDANPFTFRLSLTVLDENDHIVSGIINYTGLSSVYLVEGTTETAVGTDYVAIDEENNTFDFTSAAVGKTFRIQTRPAEVTGTQEEIDDCTRSLTVKVVAGYNVTDAKELNLMTNTDVEMHEQYKNADERDLPENWQGSIAKDYIDQHFGQGYYLQYGDQLQGLVLHCDLAPTVNDIPEAYIANKGATTGMGFDDSFAIYDRFIGGTSYITGTATPNTFAIYGNYFTVNTSGMPMMSDDPDIVGTLVASNSWIFRFKNNPNLRQQSVEQAQAFDFTQYPTLLENIRLRDDDPNSNNEAENHRHMFGMNTFSINMVDATYDNVIIEAYTISTVISDTNTRLTIKDSVLNNAWQNHVFAWTNNYLQSFYGDEYEAMAPWDNIVPMEINVINSKLTKCGGPVILQQCDDMFSPHNAKTGVTLNVDSVSELYSYVTGTEAWFQAYPFAATYATNIKAMSTLIENTTGNAASLTTTRPGNGDTKFLNMVFASLNGQAKYTVDGVVLTDTTDATVTAYKTQGIPAAGGASLAQLEAPLFQSTVDPNATATYLEGAFGTPTDSVINTNVLSGGDGVVTAPFAQGDYLNMFFGTEVSVVLGYYHPAS